MYALTAAHPTLPFQTLVRVTNLENGKEVELRINDRGPFVEGRVIDLSYTGAQTIEMLGQGTARVAVEATLLAEGKGFSPRGNLRHPGRGVCRKGKRGAFSKGAGEEIFSGSHGSLGKQPAADLPRPARGSSDPRRKPVAICRP